MKILTKIAIISLIISKTDISSKNVYSITYANSDKYFTTDYSQKIIFEKQEVELNLKSTSNVVKYKITIHSPTLIPIYDANFPYDVMTERGTAIFNLDEFPPENLTLSFSASTKNEIQIKIIAFIQKNSNDIVEAEKIILINGQN